MEAVLVPGANFNHVGPWGPEAQEKDQLCNVGKGELNPQDQFSLKGPEAGKIKTMEN